MRTEFRLFPKYYLIKQQVSLTVNVIKERVI